MQKDFFSYPKCLSDLQMKNVMTSTKNAAITIKEIPRPDLEPSDVTFTQTEIGPGSTLDVAWKVKMKVLLLT